MFLTKVYLYTYDHAPRRRASFPEIGIIRTRIVRTPSLQYCAFVSRPCHLSRLSFQIKKLIRTFSIRRKRFFQGKRLVTTVSRHSFIVRGRHARTLCHRTRISCTHVSDLCTGSGVSNVGCRRTGTGCRHAGTSCRTTIGT